MTLSEAEEILYLKNRSEDLSCSCHINPPCGKCVNTPSEEDVEEAKRVVNVNS